LICVQQRLKEEKMHKKRPLKHGAMLTLRISPETIAKIDAEANEQQRTRANMVRVIIEDYFKDKEKTLRESKDAKD